MTELQQTLSESTNVDTLVTFALAGDLDHRVIAIKRLAELARQGERKQ